MSVSKYPPYADGWNKAKSAAVEFAAAGFAIVPTYYMFQWKSESQTGKPRPQYCPVTTLRAGIKAAPITMAMIGAQRVAQNEIEVSMQKKPEGLAKFSTPLMSAMIVGTISTPAMAIFTGLTKNKSAMESLRALTPRQTIACIVVEGGFLAGMGITDPIIKVVQDKFGKRKVVDYAVAFGSGAAGAAIGHSGDSALTMWQNGIKINRFSQLLLGIVPRAIGVGGYNCFNKLVKDTFS